MSVDELDLFPVVQAWVDGRFPPDGYTTDEERDEGGSHWWWLRRKADNLRVRVEVTDRTLLASASTLSMRLDEADQWIERLLTGMEPGIVIRSDRVEPWRPV